MFGIENEYKYIGKILDADSFADVLITLFDHDTFTKECAITAIRNYHHQNGGKCDDTDWDTIFHIVTDNILEGYLIKIDIDTYKLSYASIDGMVDDMEFDDELDMSGNISCDMIIGNGKGAVYVYYYDTYKDYYTKSGSRVWPCKIGMSFSDPMKRIFSQIGTASPELPHPALIIYTDKPKELETMLHAALKVQGAHIENGPGREWFMTTPKIVQGLYERMLG